MALFRYKSHHTFEVKAVRRGTVHLILRDTEGESLNIWFIVVSCQVEIFKSLKFSLVAIKYFQIGYGPKRKRKLRGGARLNQEIKGEFGKIKGGC